MDTLHNPDYGYLTDKGVVCPEMANIRTLWLVGDPNDMFEQCGGIQQLKSGSWSQTLAL
jgi:hypothetical protein